MYRPLSLAFSAILLAGSSLAATVRPLDSASALRRAGRWSEAAQLWLDWLAEHPSDSRGHYELGVLYALTGQWSAAARQFSLATQGDAPVAEAWRALGDVERAADRCAAAFDHTQLELADHAA